MPKPLFTALKITLLSFSLPLLCANSTAAKDCTQIKVSQYIDRLAYRDQTALNAVANCGTEAIPALINSLSIPDTESRTGSQLALVSIGTEAISPLIKALDTNNADAREAAANALSKIGAEAVPAMITALQKGNDNTRLGVTKALYPIGSDAEAAVPALIETLRDENLHVRRQSATALGGIGSQKAVPALIDTINNRNESEWVRRNAVWALGDIGSQEAVPILIELLKDDSPEVRNYAANALGRVGMSSNVAVPALIEALALKDQNPTVRISAAEALGNFGSDAQSAVPLLISLLNDQYPDARKNAASALSQITEGLYDKAESLQELDKAVAITSQIQNALSRTTDFEDARLRADRTLKALNDKRESLIIQAVVQWTSTGKNIWLAHAAFWLALISAYPQSPQIQAIFFWNPWMRKIMGLGYVGFALTWVPFLRRSLFAPFRESLLADAGLDNFKPEAYFENSEVKHPNSGDIKPIQEAIPGFKGQIVLEGASGLGKTMFLRHLCQQSKRVIVYLPATKCADGVIEAIQKKLHGEEIKDPKFLQNLIYSGAIAICIDGLNEVSADTRAKIVEFTENYFKGDIILATQPMEWTPPATAKKYVMQPLGRSHIQDFLLSRKTLIPEDAPVRGEAYEQSCSRYLEQILDKQQTLEELEATQRILSNPMDLTVIASMLAADKQPDLLRLQEQQYRVMTEEYQEKHLGQEFPLDSFSEAIYQMRLKDETALPEAQFLEELLGMERHKMVVSRQTNDSEGKPAREWYFRHDKIAEFFILQTFLEHPERQEQHLGDPPFRGVYFMLASFLKLEDAIALREMLIQYAADTKDHTVSDTFVQLLRSRKIELIQTAA